MKIAVEGCAHGELEKIYDTLKHMETVENTKIDLLICCGDFEAMRNLNDLQALACPEKYRTIGSFWKYYSGEEVAPYPTVFVGGNHEASNYLWELFYGGYVAPNIYFLGFAGVINFGGIRIGGLSGISKPRDYRSGHFERTPYDDNDMRSIYHIREYDVRRLLEVKDPLDIFVSHDWPRGIALHGNKEELLRRKPFLRQEVENGTLGSGPSMQILRALKPQFWFSAHLHVKFAAIVQHPNDRCTKFLALDKCLPRRDFLQVLEIPGTEKPLEFNFDEEWLAITRAYHPYLPLTRSHAALPNLELCVQCERQWVKKLIAEKGNIDLPPFQITADPYNPDQGRQIGVQASSHPRNPQTVAFLELLDLHYTFDITPAAILWDRRPSVSKINALSVANVGEIRLEDGHGVEDPNEIPLDDGDEDALPDDVNEFESAINADVMDPDEIVLESSGGIHVRARGPDEIVLESEGTIHGDGRDPDGIGLQSAGGIDANQVGLESQGATTDPEDVALESEEATPMDTKHSEDIAVKPLGTICTDTRHHDDITLQSSDSIQGDTRDPDEKHREDASLALEGLN